VTKAALDAASLTDMLVGAGELESVLADYERQANGFGHWFGRTWRGSEPRLPKEKRLNGAATIMREYGAKRE